MIGPPPTATFDEGEIPRKAWIDWTKLAWRTIKKDKGSGVTADRPTNGIAVADYYFDTDLGYIIHYDGTNWVDGTGATV